MVEGALLRSRAGAVGGADGIRVLRRAKGACDGVANGCGKLVKPVQEPGLTFPQSFDGSGHRHCPSYLSIQLPGTPLAFMAREMVLMRPWAC